MSEDQGYIDYFAVLDLGPDCKTGEVNRSYKKQIKALLVEISRTELTPELRDKYLLDLATHNAAFYILRDNERREQYIKDRQRVIKLESEWRQAVESGNEAEAERLRRAYDAAARHFLSRYLEEYMLEAGRDAICVENSHWDRAHERHAGRVLRHYRQRRYHEIHERLPYSEITEPEIDWDERQRRAREILREGAA